MSGLRGALAWAQASIIGGRGRSRESQGDPEVKPGATSRWVKPSGRILQVSEGREIHDAATFHGHAEPRLKQELAQYLLENRGWTDRTLGRLKDCPRFPPGVKVAFREAADRFRTQTIDEEVNRLRTGAPAQRLFRAQLTRALKPTTVTHPYAIQLKEGAGHRVVGWVAELRLEGSEKHKVPAHSQWVAFYDNQGRVSHLASGQQLE